MLPTLTEFRTFCRSIEGEVLLTQARAKPFSVALVAGSLYFIPVSSGKKRKADQAGISQVIVRLSKTGSQVQAQYKDITFNASYILEIIRQWQVRR
ncbi:MAG: hypothetical protein Q8K74_01965 [Candidatus Nitrotoga sp.]|nr:hypothetical protein [Candidatus Nitrotoga sp.]MDP1854801.1 hypothetical protein [Candidatus Nitrotoga sp.]MDP3498583.1 hypothetical protein [Candidatus Nitrotoga sp.]